MENIILITLITGTIAIILNLILKRFDVPPIIGYIFSGAIIGAFFSKYYHIIKHNLFTL